MSMGARLAQAAKLHDAGQFDAARRGYLEVIEAEPRHARAFYLLGLLENASGDAVQAARQLQCSLDIDPAQGDVWRAWGDLLSANGDVAQAVEAYRRSVQHDKASALGWFRLGFTHEQLRQFDAAEKAYRRAIRLQPVFPEAWCNLGNVLHELDRNSEAVAALRRAVAQRPGFAEAWRNLGSVLEAALHQQDAALECLDQACQVRPDFTEAHFSRGVLLAAMGRKVDALQAYQRVFELAPAHVGAFNNLGTIYLEEWLLDEARACFERVLAVDAGQAEALYNLGNVHLREQCFDEAADCFQRSIAVSPNLVAALNGAGLAAQELGEADEAVRWFERALAMQPAFPEARANLAMACVQRGDNVAARAAFLQVFELAGNPMLRLRAASLLPAIMGTMASIDAEREAIMQGLQALSAQPDAALATSEPQLMQYLDPPFYFAYRGWNNREALSQLASLHRRMTPELGYEAAHIHRRRTRQRVRVGFVSSFFFHHSVGTSFARLLAELKADPRLELIGISLGSRVDDLTASVAASCAAWVTPRGTLSAIRSAIAELELDVLFFTDVGMDRITYPLALSRLARVQCLSGGHPETTGSDNIDYLISSRWLEPPEAQAFYTERLVLLDAYNTALIRPEVAPSLLNRSELGIRPGEHIYLCPVKLHKLHPDFDAALAAIIERDARARVVLFADERQRHWQPLTEARMALTMGAAASRVHFEPWADARTFQSWLHGAHAVLDCWPFGMGTTAITALGLGIPVLTLPSERMSGRSTRALLRQVGVDWLIADSRDDYLTKAVILAGDASLREHLGKEVRARSDLLFIETACASELADFLAQRVNSLEIA